MKKKLIDLLSRAFVEVDARDLAALAEYLLRAGVIIDGDQTDDAVNGTTKTAIDYLNKKSGRKFRPCPAYRRFIKDILAQGYNIDDIKTVVDNKCADWLNDEKYSRYLRPETIFGPRFQAYLNQKKQNENVRYGNFDPRDALKRAIERSLREAKNLK